MISGLHKPDAGAIRFDGQRIDGSSPIGSRGRGISRTFQISRQLGESDRAGERRRAVAGRRLAPISSAEHVAGASASARWTCSSFVGIADLAREPAGEAVLWPEEAHGSRRRPDGRARGSFLLDEPAGGINPALLEVIVDRVRRLRDAGRHLPDRRAQHGRGHERLRSGRGDGLRQVPGARPARRHPERRCGARSLSRGRADGAAGGRGRRRRLRRRTRHPDRPVAADRARPQLLHHRAERRRQVDPAAGDLRPAAAAPRQGDASRASRSPGCAPTRSCAAASASCRRTGACSPT